MFIYKGPIIELTVNFSSATTDAKRQKSVSFRVLRAKIWEPSFSSIAKLSFKSKGKIETFGHVHYLRKLLSHGPPLNKRYRA